MVSAGRKERGDERGDISRLRTGPLRGHRREGQGAQRGKRLREINARPGTPAQSRVRHAAETKKKKKSFFFSFQVSAVDGFSL